MHLSLLPHTFFFLLYPTWSISEVCGESYCAPSGAPTLRLSVSVSFCSCISVHTHTVWGRLSSGDAMKQRNTFRSVSVLIFQSHSAPVANAHTGKVAFKWIRWPVVNACTLREQHLALESAAICLSRNLEWNCLFRINDDPFGKQFISSHGY